MIERETLKVQEPEATAGQPVKERLLPQTSIRFFVFLIAVSALVMYTFRAALVGDELWAKCASAVIMTAIGCFLSYIVLFLIALPFASAASALAHSPHAAAANLSAESQIAESLTGGDGLLTQQDTDAFEANREAIDRSQDSTESQ